MKMIQALLVSIALFVTASPGVHAKTDYPSRSIRLIVPWGPGGFNDVLARLMAAHMTKSMGQPVVVENRPGATGTIGSEYVARAAPDGYTVLLVTADTHAIAPIMFPKLHYDPVKDFTPITLLCEQPVFWFVTQNSPAKTIQDFVKIAKTSKNPLSFASIGVGSTTHLGGEMFKAAAGIQLLHVPFKGSSPGITEVLAGRVDAIPLTLGGAGAFATSGKLRALAIMANHRSSLAPDVPTMAEAGFHGVELALWNGAVLPKGASPEIVDRLQREMKAALQTQEVQHLFKMLGVDVIASTPAQFHQFMQEEVTRWAGVAKKANVHPD